MSPDASVVDVADIAHALSQTCRYGGHTSQLYSVAEHSVLVYLNGLIRMGCDNRVGLMALLFHDAAEVYLDDAVAPFKELPQMEWYRDLEAAWMGAICEKLGVAGEVDAAMRELVKKVDDEVRGIEMAYLFPTAPAEVKKSWGFNYGGVVGEIGCLEPSRAEQSFLCVFNRIEAMR
ncbi:MAG TPA: hypothetical protein VMS77_09835 [Conexivisphaerales archaeon]|nr:hypothetical protein [Conexivisphaerales archaeon]